MILISQEGCGSVFSREAGSIAYSEGYYTSAQSKKKE